MVSLYQFRDIKPENILLEKEDPENLNIKITDFGFACFFKPGEYRKEVLGSPLYMSRSRVPRGRGVLCHLCVPSLFSAGFRQGCMVSGLQGCPSAITPWH